VVISSGNDSILSGCAVTAIKCSQPFNEKNNGVRVMTLTPLFLYETDITVEKGLGIGDKATTKLGNIE